MFINETFALFLLIGSIVVKWSKSTKAQFVILFLLLIPLFDILSYSYTIENGDRSITYSSGKFDSLINPLVFLVFIVYLIINISGVKKLFKFVLRGSDNEIEEREKKETTFYYDKFNSSTNKELGELYKMYKDYPYTAQVALDKIKGERNL